MTTTISNDTLTAKIMHVGAELFSLKSNEGIEYIWEGNPLFWGKHSPVLFPIVGTLKNNSYQYNGIKYPLSRHGFAREMEFQLIDTKLNSATFSLQSNSETLKRYPFEFELQLIYTLEKSRLTIQYCVINKTKKQMPFCLGAHPAFALPGNFENYSLKFEKQESLHYHLLENDLISDTIATLKIADKKLPLSYKLFEKDALIFKKLDSKSITILDNLIPKIKINFEDFPNLGIWTIPDAPFICIEPWFGYADTIKNTDTIFDKEGIQILESEAVFTAKFNIEIL